ncbi:hypothetical protein [Vibrio renipiscarius]|uniref:hypothetical protein n=1 Tax=Vibrio renipiscarius TaxID=1461322 RepID=UPI0006998A2E|nr:hypothetical protein [Vibrio renipiscarius]
MVFSCLNKAVFDATQWINTASNGALRGSSNEATQWQSLYQRTFQLSLNDAQANIATSDNRDPCHVGQQSLPQLSTKTDWLAPFIVLCLLLAWRGRFVHTTIRRLTPAPQPKRRLHLTHCVFQE